MKIQQIFILFLALVTSLSCEKVIDVDVDDADDQIIVEAVLVNKPLSSFVILSESGPLFEEGDIQFIDSAQVLVSDQSGNSYTFSQIASGIYTNTTFQAQQNETYNLNINAQNKTFTAQAQTPEPISFDSTYIDYDYISPFGDSSDRIHVTFTDLPSDNTYRIIAYRNGEKTEGFSLYNDEIDNGGTRDGNIYNFDIEQGDTIYVDLMSTNQAYYDYFDILSTTSGNPFSSAPGNPPSNIESDSKTQGYLGVLTRDRDTLYATQ